MDFWCLGIAALEYRGREAKKVADWERRACRWRGKRKVQKWWYGLKWGWSVVSCLLMTAFNKPTWGPAGVLHPHFFLQVSFPRSRCLRSPLPRTVQLHCNPGECSSGRAAIADKKWYIKRPHKGSSTKLMRLVQLLIAEKPPPKSFR